MFKKFDEKEHVSGVNNIKSSIQRGIRAKLLEQFPYLSDYLDQIIPKKDPLRIAKCHEHIEILVGKDGELLFYKQRDGPYFPTLRLLHKYPFMLPKMQVDKGAIRFILSGANIMCPGLTSPGAKMTNVASDTVVAVTAEGKENALAVGVTKMSAEKILDVNKGIGIETIHYLNDGLWHMKTVE
ncbi:Malignant T-cell-amplified sequence 1 [Lamellibrachia satsuma]|nr:Malignant T-cell-amplified sequence 1 [Lamellibrachia satsuma]